MRYLVKLFSTAAMIGLMLSLTGGLFFGWIWACHMLITQMPYAIAKIAGVALLVVPFLLLIAAVFIAADNEADGW